MKPLPFTIPKVGNATFVIQEEKLQTFYPHLHRHKEIQICWIKKGRGTLIVQADFHNFQDDDIFIIASNCAHLFKNEADTSIEMLSVFFNPNPEETLLMQVEELQTLCEAYQNIMALQKLSSALKKELSSLSALKGSSQLHQFLHILNIIEPTLKSNQYGKLVITEESSDKMKIVMEYIIQNFHKNIDLKKIAKLIHYSPEAFCRFFKRRTGKTFITYLSECRINEARKKLLEKDKPEVSRIAYECGFNNVSNFNRVFKLQCNCSPLQYRRQYFSKLSQTNISD